MVIRVIPPGGGFGMNEDAVLRQITLIDEAQDTVDRSRLTMRELGQGQTALLWTADGKSVELAAALRTRYEAGERWLDAIAKDLATARENLHTAIEETRLLNDQQKEHYHNLLNRTGSTTSPQGPVAV
ncbi:hypothetical protein [Microbacterium soli]|uniref:Uncharacterized protein n=1 Tax=Microbacterium soli TaxID=446075 RepID=A0ABP7MZ58_9MICO